MVISPNAQAKESQKPVLAFQTLMPTMLWQMGRNSQEGFYLGQELLLDFAAWIDLTLSADNSIISATFKVSEHILLL